MTMPENRIAFFYKNPVVLDRDTHKDLRFDPVGSLEFASQTNIVPLVLAEFPHACHEYPIIFLKGPADQWMTVAVTGLQSGKNRFVTENNQWDASYIPAAVRRYPFILAESAPNQYTVAADLDAPHFNAKGEPVFQKDGSAAPFMQQIMDLLTEFQNQAIASTQFVQRLVDAELLTETTLGVQNNKGESASVAGAWIVDEAKLGTLGDSQALALFRSGDLAMIHAHLLSLRNLIGLLQSNSQPSKTIKAEKPEAKKTVAAVKKSVVTKPAAKAAAAKKPATKKSK